MILNLFMSEEESQRYLVSAFYKFAVVEEPEVLKLEIEKAAHSQELKGTVLVAHEGLNGTIAGEEPKVEAFFEYLKTLPGFENLNYKRAFARFMPFHRMKVKLKKEIVTLGQPGVDPTQEVGEYIEPEDWNALISDPEVTLVDTRNDYEFAVGTFKGAIDPETKSFRDFPEYVAQNMDPKKQKKVAMFCTGGIRCEKATAYMLQQGFEKVYHLNGGILEYLNRIPEEESLWEGDCFVFDDRVTVDHDLEKGSYDMCHACRMPLSRDDLGSPYYEEGVSCPHCYERLTPEKKARLEQRNLQMQLANDRNEKHLGQTQERHLKAKLARLESTAD